MTDRLLTAARAVVDANRHLRERGISPLLKACEALEQALPSPETVNWAQRQGMVWSSEPADSDGAVLSLTTLHPAEGSGAFVLSPEDGHPVPGSLWRHWKGSLVRVSCVLWSPRAPHAFWVVYEHADDAPKSERWARPLSEWHDHIERDGYLGPRFVLAAEAGAC